MANEATVLASVRIIRGNLRYQNQPTSFQVDVDTTVGPSPGAIAVPTDGVDVYFDQISEPGICVIRNLDQDNYVEVGIKDPQTDTFYPMIEVGPGETWPMKLSRNLGEQYAGSGTGTTAPENYLRLKANGASCIVIVDAFGR